MSRWGGRVGERNEESVIAVEKKITDVKVRGCKEYTDERECILE